MTQPPELPGQGPIPLDPRDIIAGARKFSAARDARSQAEFENRAAIENYANGLLVVCAQPQILSILHGLPDYPFFVGNTSVNDPSSRSFRVGASLRIGMGTNYQNENVFFLISHNQRNAGPAFYREMTTELHLDSSIPWRRRKKDKYGEAYEKMLTLEDLIQHPNWLTSFHAGINRALFVSQTQIQAEIQSLRTKTDQFTAIPLPQIIDHVRNHGNLPAHVDQVEVAVSVQAAARSTIEQVSPLPEGVSEARVREIVTEMIFEHLAALQIAPQNEIVSPHTPQIEAYVHQMAQGSQAAENVMKRFLRRSRDPEKVYRAFLELYTLIPGADKLVAVLKAINIMFGPEETTQ